MHVPGSSRVLTVTVLAPELAVTTVRAAVPSKVTFPLVMHVPLWSQPEQRPVPLMMVTFGSLVVSNEMHCPAWSVPFG